MSLTKLPKDLTVPLDDGSSDHLYGMKWPTFTL